MKNLIAKSALALAIVAGTASIAAADVTTLENSTGNYISTYGVNGTNSGVDFSLIRTADAGTVYVYEDNHGTQGDLLGKTTVNAGANTDVRVNFDLTSDDGNYIAVFVPAASDQSAAAVLIEG
ncbi:hypothetical protein AQS8620_01849 [Aquimixticola soesokkakensis]|uniref:Uncharacterized protein n=1 Tax=Aquimixticola soesokkakensis TaxID=1519096 RepID=A0A1Y5SUE2_9RHOB|nr:hypothetical protein [Aquimixticola soesokkakensis]SLN45375.1 hypothetical protein AQS8620_01849 [Aquimixticola soesokkakensis]